MCLRRAVKPWKAESVWSGSNGAAKGKNLTYRDFESIHISTFSWIPLQQVRFYGVQFEPCSLTAQISESSEQWAFFFLFTSTLCVSCDVKGLSALEHVVRFVSSLSYLLYCPLGSSTRFSCPLNTLLTFNNKTAFTLALILESLSPLLWVHAHSAVSPVPSWEFLCYLTSA